MPRLADPVTKYARAVVAGRRLACKFVRQACRRHLADLKRDDIFFDLNEVHRAIGFIELLPHIKGGKAGQPLKLEPAQAFIVGSIFGWRRKADRRRRYRYAYVEIPRKNGKSTLASGIALYMLIADGEPGAEVYSAATTRDQARIVWDVSKSMVQKAPWLNTRVKAFHSSLIYGDSVFRPLSSDANTKDGLNPHGIVIDEFHAWPNRDFFDVLDDAFGARSQPLLFIITTAGNNTEGICYVMRAHCLNVLEPETQYDDDTYFAYVSTIDGHDGAFDTKEEQANKDDWTQPRTWRKANFLLGHGKEKDYMEEQVKRAKLIPSKRNTVLNKQLDVWTEIALTWLDVVVWDTNTTKIELERLEGQPCFSGLDLSSRVDITAHVLAFPPGVYDKWALVPFLYLPADNIRHRVLEDRVPYDQWIDQGWIKTTPGSQIDLDFIERDYMALADRFNIIETGFDPWKAQQVAQHLTDQGATMIEMRQGHQTLGGPTRAFETMLYGNELLNDGNPCLRWMAKNAVVRTDPNENIVPDKKKATKRIDGIVASIMALGRGLAGEGPSQYETGQLDIF